MIANGGSYRNARWWANHLKARENDRAEVVASYGLRSDNIPDMLREMEALAQGTRCENYFYQMNLNPVGNEQLTEQQWDRAREIAEKHHGFEGQAYFVVEHVKNGRLHHHIVWSRVDLETMRAISDSHDARTNHAIARRIEWELGLQKVTGPYDREPGEPRPKRAPKPWEMYRGMKTGLDPRDIAAEVTELFHQSGSGREFQQALEAHGYMLVQGDRRGFLILDTAGKEHSLARRLDGVTTKELNAFMRDVDRQSLPTVEQGKAMYQEMKIAGLEADRATVAQEIAWEEKLAKAAIEREAVLGRFVEPKAGKGTAVGDKELRNLFEPPATLYPHPQLNQTSPQLWFEDVAHETTLPHPIPDPPENLKGAAADIWTAWHRSATADTFAAALDEHGIALAAVTKDEADQSHRRAEFAKAVGNYAPRYEEGEIVAISPAGLVYKINERTTGEKPAAIERFLSRLDREQLQGIEATRQTVEERADLLEIERQAFRDLSSVGVLQEGITTNQLIHGALDVLSAPRYAAEDVAQTIQMGANAAGKAMDAIADIAGEALEIIGDMFCPTAVTPERVQAALDAQDQRAKQREIDLAKQRDDDDHARRMEAQRQEERKREEERKRYRDDRER
jgi:hypothetical protein